MLHKIVSSSLGIILFASPLFASADVLSDLQAQIQTLLTQIAALKAQLGTGATVGASASACVTITSSLSIEDTDADNNGEVSKLQQFLSQDASIYPEGRVTGYFGPATQRAVQRWQRAHSIVSSGTPDTTGYGFVGSRTRAAMACGGQATQSTNTYAPPTTTYIPPTTYTPPPVVITKSDLVPDTLKIVYPSSDINIGVSQKITVTYSVGSNIVANDPAIVVRKIVNAGTDTSVSGYIPVSVSSGTYTFDWTPNEAGKYQAVLNISHNNTTYPARSGVITVGNATTPTPTNTLPGITFSSISSGNVIGSFANLPANSQIRFVNAATGQPYYAQSTMVWSGGSGPLSIAIPNDLPGGTYYLRVTDYYNPNTTIAQSSSFQAGTDVQTKSVIINSFTASPATITTGQAVMFTWNSNLTTTDISHYSGGCSIEGLANNQALYVTSGLTGASGSVTYVPPAAATYTLRCYSGGKDGSPSASRQITVNVNLPQTNPVVISSFSASQSSVISGQPVTFSWNSNLTSTDISYGGGCSIEGFIPAYNQVIQITSGFSGASGSVAYTPAHTATYTLTCSSGGKDGSPMDTKKVTVSVN